MHLCFHWRNIAVGKAAKRLERLTVLEKGRCRVKGSIVEWDMWGYIADS